MANVKITELTEDTAPTTDDVLAIVNEPGGTPVTKKTTLANLLTAALYAIRALSPAASRIPYYTGSAAAGLLTLDTDGTLAGNSDTAVATQKAGKTYADTKIAKATNVTAITDTGIADGEIAVFNLSNKDIRTSNVLISTDGTLAGNADTNVPTEKAVKTYADMMVTTQILAGFVYERENVVEDLSYLPPVTATWDPAELADGVGETSAAIAYPGVALGLFTIEAIAPYDLQGITCNAWVDAANSVKARLQNETAGTIDLASGTWAFQARRI